MWHSIFDLLTVRARVAAVFRAIPAGVAMPTGGRASIPPVRGQQQRRRASATVAGRPELQFWASGSEHYNVHVVVTAKNREVVICSRIISAPRAAS
jgi:hypothetical protein